jgi:hypothetical protein
MDVVAIEHAMTQLVQAKVLPGYRRPLVVAVGGTAITSHHMDLLDDLAPGTDLLDLLGEDGVRELIPALDGDAAGRKALAAQSDVFADWPGRVSPTLFPNGADPAQLLERQGPHAVWNAIGPSRRALLQVLVDLRIEHIYDRIRARADTDELIGQYFEKWRDELETQVAVARAVAPLLIELGAAGGFDLMRGEIARVSEKYHVDPQTLMDQILGLGADHVDIRTARRLGIIDSPDGPDVGDTDSLAARVAARSARLIGPSSKAHEDRRASSGTIHQTNTSARAPR